MKKSILGAILSFTLMVVLTACAGMKPSEPPLTFSPASFPTGQYAPKVDNFEFILDASYTMSEADQRDFMTAKNLIAAINKSLPADVPFNGALRTFGHHPLQSKKATELVYGMVKYTRDGLQKGVDSMKYAGGNSPLPEALEAAGSDLKELRGPSAIIIVSDGVEKLEMDGAKAAAGKLKSDLGNKVCIYTVAVGGDPAGEKFLEEIAQVGGCGSTVTAASLTSSGSLAAFVEKVFLVPARDSDGDGVGDYRDKCPNTPRGELVDENGCTLKLTLHINFDFDKADIKAEFEADLKKAGDFVQMNQKVPYIIIEGYTDSVGDAGYNQQLSERRAQAVREYLIDTFGVDPKRLIARGGGETNPVASNDTEEGRAENRRVEIVCCAVAPPR